MRFSKYLLTILFFACGFLANAQQKFTITLQQCLDTAVKNNLTVKQNGLYMEQDRINFNQAKENLLPYINGDVSRTRSQGRGINPVTNTYVNQALTYDNYSLNAGIVLFNGLNLQNAIKQAKLAYQAGKMDYQAAKDQVTIGIITNYLLVLDAEEILNQSKSQSTVAKENLDRSETLEKYGNNKVASDYTDFKGAYAGSLVNIVNAENSLNAAKLSLFNLMNMKYNPDVELAPISAENLAGEYGVTSDQVYATALDVLAQVKAADFRRQSAEKGVKVAQGQLYPTLALNGSLTTNYSSEGQRSVFVDSTVVPTGGYINTPLGKQNVLTNQANYTSQNISYIDQFKNNYGTALTLGLNIPIFANHTKRNAIAIAKLNLLNEQYIEENIKVQLRQSVQQAWYNMMAAYNKYKALDAQVTAYTESYRISKIRLDAGVLTTPDFIISKNNLDGATLNLITARYDYYIYSKILDYYQGKLSL
jgi:outer membrane protein